MMFMRSQLAPKPPWRQPKSGLRLPELPGALARGGG
jgi:hypothetical protein